MRDNKFLYIIVGLFFGLILITQVYIAYNENTQVNTEIASQITLNNSYAEELYEKYDKESTNGYVYYKGSLLSSSKDEFTITQYSSNKLDYYKLAVEDKNGDCVVYSVNKNSVKEHIILDKDTSPYIIMNFGYSGESIKDCEIYLPNNFVIQRITDDNYNISNYYCRYYEIINKYGKTGENE